MMAPSPFLLSYCTNVHPGRSIAEVERGLDEYTVPVHERYGHPLAAGLWLAQPVVRELLQSPDRLPRFAQRLAERDLTCHTLNAFPFGDFHGECVKENVYLPDWSSPDRLEYTSDCARVLAALLPEGGEGSLSTLPLAFSLFQRKGLIPDCISQLIQMAKRLDRLHADTGRLIRLAIEPEPFCLLELTDATIEFFESSLRPRAADEGALDLVNRHLGVCFDVCHQAVEFEDVAQSIAALRRAHVRINKVHITCAIELDDPSNNREGLEALARYVEPRYLHQTIARCRSGELLRVLDLTAEHVSTPARTFLDADVWRVHFHVPVDAEHLGPLGTTRGELRRALTAVAQLDYLPHLEVETYTWEVLPDAETPELVSGITRELVATRELLSAAEWPVA